LDLDKISFSELHWTLINDFWIGFEKHMSLPSMEKTQSTRLTAMIKICKYFIKSR